MPMIFNIHTPTHSFALPFRAGENADALLDRILRKAGFAQTTDQEKQDFKKGKGGAGVRYEFEGGRWTLADGEWQAGPRGVNRASERNEDVGGRNGRDDVKSSTTTRPESVSHARGYEFAGLCRGHRQRFSALSPRGRPRADLITELARPNIIVSFYPGDGVRR
jgi:hypothetical protein